jgi:hypothetical protein
LYHSTKQNYKADVTLLKIEMKPTYYAASSSSLIFNSLVELKLKENAQTFENMQIWTVLSLYTPAGTVHLRM